MKKFHLLFKFKSLLFQFHFSFEVVCVASVGRGSTALIDIVKSSLIASNWKRCENIIFDQDCRTHDVSFGILHENKAPITSHLVFPLFIVTKAENNVVGTAIYEENEANELWSSLPLSTKFVFRWDMVWNVGSAEMRRSNRDGTYYLEASFADQSAHSNAKNVSLVWRHRTTVFNWIFRYGALPFMTRESCAPSHPAFRPNVWVVLSILGRRQFVPRWARVDDKCLRGQLDCTIYLVLLFRFQLTTEFVPICDRIN